MSSRDRLNLDVLIKALKRVDQAHYDHNLMAKVLDYLAELPKNKQEFVIKHATGVNATLKQLLEHIRQQFVVLKQVDEDGTYCGLGFGKKCVSVATWASWKTPQHAKQVDVTNLCYKGTDGVARCGHLLEFAEIWMELNDATFDQFIEGIPHEEVEASD